MFHYDLKALREVFGEIIREHVSPETFEWLSEKTLPGTPTAKFNSAFVSAPRKTGKKIIEADEQLINAIGKARPRMTIKGWSIDRLTRVWLLMHLDSDSRENYFKTIDSLFLAAEVNELVALYSSLPVLAYPEIWRSRCAEGIRSNISDVLTAIMCNNPYPSENLDEAAWNQLVLKAFFTEKPIDQIIGLDERNNLKLALTLSDYAHERWAAHRTVNPLIWRCVAPYAGRFVDDIRKIAASDNPLEQQAAALAVWSSKDADAKKLVPEHLLKEAEQGTVTWNSLAEKMKNYVLQ